MDCIDSLQSIRSALKTIAAAGDPNPRQDLIKRAVSIVDQIAKSYSEMLTEIWKAYVKLLKEHSAMLTSETCGRIADYLSTMLVDGVACMVSSPSTQRLALLFFYAQRASATLAYCADQLDVSKAHDLIYLLAASRGVVCIKSVAQLNIDDDMGKKMESVFSKALEHPDRRDDARHRALLEDFSLARNDSQKDATFGVKKHIVLCKAIGMLFISLSQFRSDGSGLLQGLDSFVNHFARSLVLHPLTITDAVIHELLHATANKVIDAGFCKSSDMRSTKRSLLNFLICRCVLPGNSGYKTIYKLIFSRIFCSLDSQSQSSVFIILKNILMHAAVRNLEGPVAEESCFLLRNLYSISSAPDRSILLQTLLDDSFLVSTSSSHVKLRYCDMIVKCFSNERLLSTMQINQDTKKLISTVQNVLFCSITKTVRLISNTHVLFALRYLSLKAKLDSCLSLPECNEKVSQLFPSLVGPNNLIKILTAVNKYLEVAIMKFQDKSSAISDPSDILSYSPTSTLNISALRSLQILFDGVRSWKAFASSIKDQNTMIYSSFDPQQLLFVTLSTASVSSNIFSLCIANSLQIDRWLRSSPTSNISSAQFKLQEVIDCGKIAFKLTVDSVLSIVDADFAPENYQIVTQTFKVLSRSFTSGHFHANVLVEWFSELESLTLDCFQSFCEELKEASKELTERLVPSHVIVACVFHEILLIIKERNKEKKGKQSRFKTFGRSEQQAILQRIVGNLSNAFSKDLVPKETWIPTFSRPLHECENMINAQQVFDEDNHPDLKKRRKLVD